MENLLNLPDVMLFWGIPRYILDIVDKFLLTNTFLIYLIQEGISWKSPHSQKPQNCVKIH